jgi:predicted 3-demethylubiquinone-9 3-methyltransferase (glyoxalase superfamily)
LSVDCADQAEVDALWEKLGEGGTYSRCGWLKTATASPGKIVPSRLPELLGGSDKAGAKRAMEAMLQMSKLDTFRSLTAMESSSSRSSSRSR